MFVPHPTQGHCIVLPKYRLSTSGRFEVQISWRLDNGNASPNRLQTKESEDEGPSSLAAVPYPLEPLAREPLPHLYPTVGS